MFFLSAKSGALLWLCFRLKDALRAFSLFFSLSRSLLCLVASFFLSFSSVVVVLEKTRKSASLSVPMLEYFLNCSCLSQYTQQLERAVCALVVLRVILK